MEEHKEPETTSKDSEDIAACTKCGNWFPKAETKVLTAHFSALGDMEWTVCAHCYEVLAGIEAAKGQGYVFGI